MRPRAGLSGFAAKIDDWDGGWDWRRELESVYVDFMETVLLWRMVRMFFVWVMVWIVTERLARRLCAGLA